MENDIDTAELVPPGTSHDPDLSALPHGERLKHHQRQLRSICLHQGIDGVKAYKVRFPEAAALRIHSAPVAYKPKPAGYSAAVVDLVRRWFEDAKALNATNRADVEGLNKLLGTTYDPANHFSKPLSASVLRKLADLFAERGAALDTRSCKTLSKVRQAVRVVQADGSARAVPLGLWGSRNDDTLTVGGQTFAIERHNGHECLRFPVDGSRLRLRLDVLTEFLSLTRLIPVGHPPHTTACSVREPAPKPETTVGSTFAPINLPEVGPNTATVAECSPGGEAPSHTSLSDRIQNLAARARQSEQLSTPDGVDPLALI